MAQRPTLDRFISKGNSGNTTSKLFNVIWKAQLDAHITHIMQPDKTLATHTALEKFYTEIDDLADTLTETYKGLYSLDDVNIGNSGKFTNPIEYFTNLYNTIDKERQTIKESFLQNQIDEIQQLIVHTLYRLKEIQD
jgi:hypothetical protein